MDAEKCTFFMSLSLRHQDRSYYCTTKQENSEFIAAGAVSLPQMAI